MASLRGEAFSVLRRASRALVYRVPGEQDCCPACGAIQILDLDVLPLRRPVGGYRTGFVSGCEDCGLVFRNPVSTPEDVKNVRCSSGCRCFDWLRGKRSVAGPGLSGTGSPTSTLGVRSRDGVRSREF